MNKPKIALLTICTNQIYWEFADKLYESAKKHFFKDGTAEVDYLFWSDMPQAPEGTQLFPTEGLTWPYPTLLRYHTMLQQEEKLREYDYIFYCDVDMLFVGDVAEEILGEGLTIARHPMYHLRRSYNTPTESNPASAAFIPKLGRVVVEDGKPRFEPLYAAGGFQGGKTDAFIKAMKEMKRMIDSDLAQNYIPIWNDESFWNAWLFRHQEEVDKAVILHPGYIYPDSLIQEYYTKVWGQDYEPKLMTLTKAFSISSEGGEAIRKQMETL